MKDTRERKTIKIKAFKEETTNKSNKSNKVINQINLN